MASTYTPLGVELQATGENAGTWGTKTNTNLQIIEQISGGYTTQAVSDSGDTTLSVSDGSTGATLSHRVIEFTGSLTASRNVTIPLDVQNFYFLKNATSGSQNVVFKYVTGTGTSATVANGKTVIAYAKADDGTNPNISTISLASDLVDDTSPQLGGDLDTNSFNIAFDDAHGINDENGNEQIIFQTTSSAVNQFDITNAATGNAPIIGASGETNVDLKILPKGTGEIVVGTGAANATITSNGSHNLILDTNKGTDSSSITIVDAANGDIEFTNNGTGKVKFNDAAYFPEATLTDASTISWDTQAAPVAKVTLGDNRTLGRFQLTDIPPSPRGIPQIEVTFDIDANGIIDVKAVDKELVNNKNIKIESGSSLSDEEIERIETRS